MGAFVSPKDTYKVTITPKDCPCLDREEWVVVQSRLNTKLMMDMQNVEGVGAGIIFLKRIIKEWSFVDDEVPVPVTDENIDSLQLDIILHLLNVTQEKLPLANLPAPSETTTES